MKKKVVVIYEDGGKLIYRGYADRDDNYFLDIYKGDAGIKKNYNGLYIEMKYGNGRTSKEQKDWIKKLNEQGYYAAVCYGFEEAREVIEKYIAS